MRTAIELTDDERDEISDAVYYRMEKGKGDPTTERDRCCVELVIAKTTGYPWKILDPRPNGVIASVVGGPEVWHLAGDQYEEMRPYIAANVSDWSVVLFGWAFGFEFTNEMTVKSKYHIKEESLSRSESLRDWCNTTDRLWVPTEQPVIIGP